MPSENALSILALTVGSFAATGALLVLSLGIAAAYLGRKHVAWFGNLVCAAAAVTAVLAVWSAIRFTTLEEEDELRELNLKSVIASSEHMRAVFILAEETLSDPLRYQVETHLDTQQHALDMLEAAIWAFHRVGPWDENRFLFHLRANIADLVVLETKLKAALLGIECSAVVTADKVDWQDRLLTTWENYLLHLGALGESFAGIDFTTEDVGYVSKTYLLLRYLASVILSAGLVLLTAGGLVAVRRRAAVRSDFVILLSGAAIIVVALVLFGFSRLGADALLERSFTQVREAYFDALILKEQLRSTEKRSTSPSVWVGISQFKSDHLAYFDDVERLSGLVKAWDEAVLFDRPAADLPLLNAALSRDELPDRVRAQLVKTFRTLEFLEMQLSEFRCSDAGAAASDPLRDYHEVWKGPSRLHHPLAEMMGPQ